MSTCFARKILVPGENQKKNWRRVVELAITAIKVDNFVWRYNELMIVPRCSIFGTSSVPKIGSAEERIKQSMTDRHKRCESNISRWVERRLRSRGRWNWSFPPVSHEDRPLFGKWASAPHLRERRKSSLPRRRDKMNQQREKTEQKGANCTSVIVACHLDFPSLHGNHTEKISVCKPNETLFRLQGSSRW